MTGAAGLYRNDRRARLYRDDRRAGLGWDDGRTGPGRNHRGPGRAGVVAAAGDSLELVNEFMFDYDRSDIRYSESRKPAEVAAYMSQNPSVRLGIAGYTDTQSTDQYNLPLSQRRVATVRDALIQAGVPADRIETGTFGTDRPMCNSSTEQCSQREGRVEVLVRASS